MITHHLTYPTTLPQFSPPCLGAAIFSLTKPCLHFDFREIDFPLFHCPSTPAKLSNDGKVFVRLSSTPPSRSRLSWSLFEGPTQCTRSRHITLGYIYTSTSRLNGDTWTTHRGTRVCPWFISFVLFWDYWVAFCLYFWLLIVRDGGLGYRKVGSILEELLHDPGWISSFCILAS
jgi:hypothetical protein